MTHNVGEGEFEPLSSRIVDEAVLFPTLRRPDHPGRLLMGVFDASGELLPDSLLDRRSGERGAAMPEGQFEVDASAQIDEAIYCGVLYHHFGHFLLESIARLWFANQHPHLPLIWAGASNWASDVPFKAWQAEILDILGVTNPRLIATTATPVTRLHMPDVGYRYDDWFHPQHAKFLAVYHGPEQDESKKLWLSRSRVDKNVRDLNAASIERRLEASGWTISYPEQQTVHEQLDRMARAAVVAGEEGSAFHTLLLLDDVSGKKFHVMRRLGAEHRNMHTVGNARGVDQDFYSLKDVVVTKATGRWVTKISTRPSEVLDILDVPVVAAAAGATSHAAAEVVTRLAAAMGASSYLEVGVESGSALPYVEMERRSAVGARLPLDPRTFQDDTVQQFELPIEQYLACVDDPRRYDIVRVAATSGSGQTRAMIASLALSHQGTKWVADLPEGIAQANRVLGEVRDLMPSLVVRTVEHRGKRYALALIGIEDSVMTAPPEDDDTSRRDERATPNNAASDHQRRHTTWDALEVNGLDAAIEALRAAVPKKQTHADPVVTALEAENAALKKKVRRLVRKQKLAEQQRRDQSEPRTQDTRARAHRAIRLLRAGEWPHRRSPGPAAPVWDEILILASPRSGTNYFCESLNAFPEVRGYFEIFNPRGVFGVGNRILPDLAENLGLSDVEDAKDSRLTEVFREHPFVALRALSEVTRTRGASAMAYKVFPRQLDLETIGHLMDDDYRHVIFITRRRIDVYISLRKALLTESWTNQSTADVRPSIDVDDFLTWARDTDDWYTDCYELARDRGKKISIARYEADIDLPRPELVQKASRALQYFGLKVTVPPDVKSPRFLRQDKAVEPFEKITAGEEVRLILQKTQNLRYALEGPLERQATEHPFM